ncbi:sodium:solute symporter family protein [Candidatus Cardinium hertigii]|jgi:Na+/proline symporter|uniref:Sodium:solute symporter family protein n=1 Tax=Candidatus Cardinium hertigii TaxID=247481 RepID=A0A3N2QBZ7_9BACT|nr:sodium:solute symporter family protein [Candidatus Cardinium hertigii]ROT47271.1 sodium:solute symporter family protein [Candidatus Cardinium hertigii]
MLSLNAYIPFLMVGGFLLLTLVVGLRFKSKTTLLREYAIGNKQFPTATLATTILAVVCGGGMLKYNVELIHQEGLFWVIMLLFSSVGILIISPLALCMGPFMQHLSMSETIGSVYGKYPRIIAAITTIGFSIVLIAIQISVMAKAINMCMDTVDSKIITIVATLVLICYSAIGGIRSVTFTDVLQFVTFTIIIPLLAVNLFHKIDNPIETIVPFLQRQEKFQFGSIFHLNINLVAILSIILSSLLSYTHPIVVQRVYMSASPIQASKAFLYAAPFGVLIYFFIILIGLFIFVSAPTLSTEQIWPHIMSQLSPVFKGWVSISLLAMGMSTADSCLHVCSVMVSHDMVESVRGNKVVSYVYQFGLSRLTSIVVGLLAMILAFKDNNVMELRILACEFPVVIITAPFILAVLGFRGTASTALIGMTTGLLTLLAWNKWIEPVTEIMGAFPCMVANGLAMMAAHYLLPQPAGSGWVANGALKQTR